jgi:hypothetical protein
MGLNNRLKKNKMLFSLILILYGFIRIFKNVYIVILFKYFSFGKRVFLFVGPIHSNHLQNFLSKIDNNKCRLILVNSDPNSFTRNTKISSRTLLIDSAIYKLLGYKKNRNSWQQNLFLKGENNLNFVIRSYIRFCLNVLDVHSIWIHDLQSGGYLLNKIGIDRLSSTKNIYASVWGNDLYYFKDIKEHKEKLAQILPRVNFLHIESYREKSIARDLGFSGTFFDISSFTMTDFSKFKKIEFQYASSIKDIYILLKGSYYLRSNIQPFIDSLRSNENFWKDKKIVIVGPSIEDVFHFSRVKGQFSNSIEFYENVSNEEYIQLLSRSKYHLSLNLSDGIPNTAPEASFVNCLPIFSNHTGLVDSLSNEISSSIVYTFKDVDFANFFQTNDDMDIDKRNEVLEKLKFLFEEKLYNRECQNKIIQHLFR